MNFGKSDSLLASIREGREMTQGEKLRLIISLSIPSILAQISATIMFFIDASMVGHLGAKASAAIGLVETTGWLMGGLGSAANMGFSVQVAHAIGANDFKRARRILRQSLVCCLIYSLTISIIGILISGQLPYWLGGTEEIAHDASIYFAIIGFCGIFFQMTGLVMCTGCRLQLLSYLSAEHGSHGCRHRDWTRRTDHGRTDALFPALPL